MGCCNSDKSCHRDEKQQSNTRLRRVPWFGIAVSLLVVLVIINWK